MRRKSQGVIASRVAIMEKRGIGQGYGSGYKPWKLVRNGFSLGFDHRIKGWKTERLHHLHSNLEISLFYLLEWSESVIDIREKYPLLPIQKTLDVAERFRITHPYDYKTGEPVVLTTDFLIELKLDHGVKLVAVSVMYDEKKRNRIARTFLERTYWHEKGIEFRLITEKDISKTVMRNIEMIHSEKDLSFAPPNVKSKMVEIESLLFLKMNQLKLEWETACAESDKELSIEAGSAMWLVKHLIANRFWLVDISRKLDTAKVLEFTRNPVIFPK